MSIAELERLSRHILRTNKYLNKGYSNAFKGHNKEIISRDSKGEYVSIFLNDFDSNYFYIRHEGEIKFNAVKGVADCGIGSTAYDNTVTMQLVCIVDDAFESALLNNLINSLSGFKSENDIIVTSAITNREQVVIKELSGIDKDIFDKIISRLKNQTIIRITFTAKGYYLPNNCFDNPCKNC